MDAILLTILILLNGLGGENFALELPGQALIAIVWATILARHGLLASLAYYAVFLVLVGMPLVTAAGAPTTGTTWLLLAGLVGMAITAFRIARGSAGSVRTAVALERAA